MNIIDKILEVNSNLFGNNPSVEKINVGFTNTIYKVNDLYIVKICINNSNEVNFINEIDFYIKNKNNNLIPKLYYSDTSKILNYPLYKYSFNCRVRKTYCF